MKPLKKMISHYMQLITWIFMAVILIVIIIIQINTEHGRAYDSSIRTFAQMEQLLTENQLELTQIQDEYERTCLSNAETIARIIENEPEVLNSIEELEKIASMTQVDEIHIFDKTGCIYAGTHPEYYGFTFESGEQIAFFKPLLDNYDLKLVQDILPNTAEQKMMQYSALWSNNKEFIVQVGMNPINVMKVTEKNSLSYIFSQFRVNSDITYLAIDAINGTIVGASQPSRVGMHLTEIGLDLEKVASASKGFHAKIDNQHSYCVFQLVGDNYIGRVVSSAQLFQRIPATVLTFTICLAAIALILSHIVTYYMGKYVVGNIRNISEKLSLIANGDTNVTIDIHNTKEFAELSYYINHMLKSLMGNNRKMSYVLSKTNMYIGIYEYHDNLKKVRFTEYTSQILLLDEVQTQEFTNDYTLFADYIQKLQENHATEEPGVFLLHENPDHYIRLEEIEEENGIFGVVIDITAEMSKLKKAEEERDIDSLTQLYNRRGFESQIAALSSQPEGLGVAALVMIDADGLKGINDTYGHKIGDVYLQKIARIINNYGIKGSLSARYGGDEFVLLLYQYDDEDELMNALKTLTYIQEHSSAYLGENLRVPLKFSMGYCLTKEHADLQMLLKEADTRMYADKQQRKMTMKNNN